MNDSDPPGAPASGTPDSVAPATPAIPDAAASAAVGPADPVAPADPGATVTEPVPPVPVEPVAPWTTAPPPPDGPAVLPMVDPARAGRGGHAPDPVRTQNRIAILGTVALVVALAFGGGFAVGRASAPGGTTTDPGTGLVPASPAQGASIAPGASPAVEPTAPPSSGPDVPSDGNRLGSADAKVVIGYWADYQCPYCAKFAQETIPQLLPRIQDGTIALVHRDYAFIGPESIDAAVAVRCAAKDGKYWAMHDAVYAAQDGENQGAFARPKLAAIATSIGLDGAKLTTCLDDHALIVDVLADAAEAVRIGIQSTPTIIVNGTRFLGIPDLARLNAAVDAAVAGATPEPQPSPSASANPWTGTKTDGLTAGDAAAPVTVALWMDYQAPDSAAIANTLGPELRTRIAAGTVSATLHDLALLGDESVLAATALRCVADQGGPAWFVSDVLSVSAQGAGAGIYTPENLLRFVAQLGVDVRAFDACLGDPSVATAVKEETAAGKADGMTAAPVIVVSAGGTEVGRFSGPLDNAKVLAAIDAAAK